MITILLAHQINDEDDIHHWVNVFLKLPTLSNLLITTSITKQKIEYLIPNSYQIHVYDDTNFLTLLDNNNNNSFTLWIDYTNILILFSIQQSNINDIFLYSNQSNLCIPPFQLIHHDVQYYSTIFTYSYNPYQNQRLHEEYQYLNIIQQILSSGKSRIDRTNIGTLSIFGTQMKFSLRNNILPLFTTKKVFFRGIVEELLWFIKGNTNSFDLSKKKIFIWDKNSTREFLDNRGLNNYSIGDLGPIYGFQVSICY